MIIIHVAIQVKQDQIDPFLQTNAAFVKTARDLNGCVTFQLYRDSWAENTFIYYQQWESEADFRAYQKSDLFAQHGGNIGPMLAGPPSANYFTGSPLE